MVVSSAGVPVPVPVALAGRHDERIFWENMKTFIHSL